MEKRETETQKRQRIYNEYIKDVTPVNNVWCNMAKAFFTGGLVSVIGQLLVNWFMTMGIGKEEAGTWMLISLIGAAALLTGFHLFGYLAKFGGAGILVPITGFANSVVSPAIEYKKEGQVFGIGVNIFNISGSVILYGVLTSWVLGVLYWIGKMIVGL